MSGDQATRRLLVDVLRRRSGATETEIVNASNFFDDGILTSLSLAYVVMDLEAELGLDLMRDVHLLDWLNVDTITGTLVRKASS